MKTWRDWFIPPADDPRETEYSASETARVESGAGHRDGPAKIKRRLPPRCATCKKFMGYNDGMYVILNTEWRVHIDCFCDTLKAHFDKGEALDLTTGGIVRMEEDN